MLSTTLAVIHRYAQEEALRSNISPEDMEPVLIQMAEYMLSASVGSKYNMTQQREEAFMLVALMDGGSEEDESYRMLMELISAGDAGSSIPSPDVAAYCTKCGQALVADDIFCPKCGTKRRIV